jgi:hypothetical protein
MVPVCKKKTVLKEVLSMETLQILEKKVETLIHFIRELKAKNVQLLEKNTVLTEKLETIERSLLTENEFIEKLNQEKNVTKIVVDDLIKSIDTMLTESQQPS